ncbi:MAG: hypothetical protein JXB32_23830 [Deltaproteobacteria bacterium]|nr:hypothetical protein [Deltaproteobacteria bacterium]
MRRADPGGLGGTLLAAAGVLLAAAPAAGRIERARTVVFEPHLGAALPAVGFVAGTVNEDYGADTFVFSEALQPAFLGGLHLAWLFPVGGEDGRCLLGPEAGIDYVVWNPDVPGTPAPYDHDVDNLDAGRMRILAGARLAGVWDWGWILGRLGLGPETANGWWENYGEIHGDTGAFLQVGFGLGVALGDWFVISLLVDAVLTFHDQDEGTHPDEWREFYFGYRSLEFNLGIGFGFLL